MAINHWESFSKRILAANQIGIRFEQENSHRYFKEDQESDFSFCLFGHGVSVKEYGSFEDALDRIDEVLLERHQTNLLDLFRQLFETQETDVIFKSTLFEDEAL